MFHENHGKNVRLKYYNHVAKRTGRGHNVVFSAQSLTPGKAFKVKAEGSSKLPTTMGVSTLDPRYQYELPYSTKNLDNSLIVEFSKKYAAGVFIGKWEEDLNDNDGKETSVLWDGEMVFLDDRTTPAFEHVPGPLWAVMDLGWLVSKISVVKQELDPEDSESDPVFDSHLDSEQPEELEPPEKERSCTMGVMSLTEPSLRDPEDTDNSSVDSEPIYANADSLQLLHERPKFKPPKEELSHAIKGATDTNNSRSNTANKMDNQETPRNRKERKEVDLDVSQLSVDNNRGTTPRASPTGTSLPFGWEEYIDPISDRPYYHNQHSGTTQWTVPVAGKITSAEASVQSLPEECGFMSQSMDDCIAKKPTRTTKISCNYGLVCDRFINSLQLPDVYFEPNFDQCYCESCVDSRGDSSYYMRGNPPKPYGLPHGWCRFGLRVPAKAHGMEAFTQWHVAFHGTIPKNIRTIIESDNLLMPGDYNIEGTELVPPSGHFRESRKPEGFDIKQVFVSPTIVYAGAGAYAKPQSWTDPKTGQDLTVQVALQVRIKPGSYKVGKETLGLGDQIIDEKIPNSELEWSTKVRGATILQAILVKCF